MKKPISFRTGLLLCVAFLAAGARRTVAVSPPDRAVLDRISADSLRANLSFLASDALEGRATPSRGLDVASEFIAAQFRRAGLEPAGKEGSYFQTARLTRVTPDLTGFQLTFQNGRDELEVKSGDVRVRSLQPLDLKSAEVVRLPEGGGDLPPVQNKVVLGLARRYGTEAALLSLQARRPALILLAGRRNSERAPGSWLEERDSTAAPVIRIASEALAGALGDNRELRVSLHLAAPKKEDAEARNVAGILRGSDEVLNRQFVLLTAHYDHLGKLPAGPGDRIYNGANDNGSGTVSVLEIASALAPMPVHPKRSILFLALYGEEEGLLGAYYYTRHPLEPLRDTIADINLEQLGRTDEQDGQEVGAFAFTGPAFSDLPARVGEAAKREGIKTYAKRGADAYFERSDNYAFALAGIVAHTVVVAFEFPDYHATGDEWRKIDYANMAKVDRGIAAGLLEIANAAERPKWSESKETARYRDAEK